MTYVLTLLILVPLIGAVIAWVAGTSHRLTKLIALAFSLVETALATSLLLGFINPGWGRVLWSPYRDPAANGRRLCPAVLYGAVFGVVPVWVQLHRWCRRAE